MKILAGSVFAFVAFIVWVYPSYETPIINGVPIVANLHEETNVETEIVCINCTSPEDNPFEVSDVAITPFAIFFDISKLAGNEEYCLYYNPSQGTLNYASARVYNITIQCSDTISADIAYVEVRILTNEPPTIVSPLTDTCTIDAKGTAADTPLTSNLILVNDTDNDPLTPILTTFPESAAVNYEVVKISTDIYPEEYLIVAKNDLSVECNSDVTFFVKFSDEKNDPVGPVVVSCAVTNHYVTPTISNVDKNIYVLENTTVGSSLITFETTPRGDVTSYTIDTSPPSEVGLFSVVTALHQLQLAGMLNYEDPYNKNITVAIQADNGFCPPETHYLNIITTDANDPPTLGPKEVTEIVYEGMITVNPEFTLADEDTDDSWTYSIVSGNDNGYFTIDTYTGVVSSTVEYDVDSTGRMAGTQSFLIQVEDTKGNAIDNATLNLFIQDANDNPPEFTAFSQGSETFTVSECDNPGGTLGSRLIASDDIDSSFQNNNSTYIVPIANQYLSVTSSGDIIQTRAIPAGTVSSLTVYAQDRGEYPNIQTSLNPVTITLVGTDCPTTVKTPTKTTIATTTTTSTSAAATTQTTTKTDANDPPTLRPKEVTKIVYEGMITVNPEFTLADEDTDDSWTYSIVSGNDNGYFTIDPYTGVVSSTVEYDVDPTGRMAGVQSLLIQVKDTKGNATDNATLTLFIQDANDNPPEFTAFSQGSETFTASECDIPGGTLGSRLIASDDIDSSFQNNNSTYIVPTANQYMTVTSSGDIIQTRAIPAGTVSSLTVYAQDRGEYPKIQTSLNPVTITLVGTDCQTTVTTPTTTTTATTTTTSTDTATPTTTSTTRPITTTTTTTTTTPTTTTTVTTITPNTTTITTTTPTTTTTATKTTTTPISTAATTQTTTGRVKTTTSSLKTTTASVTITTATTPTTKTTTPQKSGSAATEVNLLMSCLPALVFVIKC